MSFRDSAIARLTNAQVAAWRHVEMSVLKRLDNTRSAVARILESCGCPVAMYDAAADSVRRHARVVVHFHPDRIGVKPVTVVEALLDDGQYRSQFETGLSSGSLTAFAGGARDAWEEALFGGAYHRAGASINERPKYGALELIRYPDGPWPRFGSCYLVLTQEVSWRASFTFSGSEQADAAERMGTIGEMGCVLAALLAEVARGARAQVPWPPFVVPTLGVEGLTVPGLLERLAIDLALARANPSGGLPGRVLDTGIEAQVHGPIELERDVERLVVDPAFAGTRTGDYLNDLARKYAIPLDWHGGFCLAAGDVPAEFRGPAIPKLARRIVGDGMVDAAVVGAAQRSLRLRPDEWRAWADPADTLQHLKQLWHVLVHYGQAVGH
jgi:Protein of unknown function (DUF3626)